MSSIEKEKLIVRIVFDTAEKKSVDFLLGVYNLKKAQDLFRFLLTNAYKKEMGDKLRYNKGLADRTLRNEEIKEHIFKINHMEPAALTAHLIELGYFPPDGEDIEPSSGNVVRHTIEVEEGGVFYFQKHYDKVSKLIYSRSVFTIPELINELIKEKKL